MFVLFSVMLSMRRPMGGTSLERRQARTLTPPLSLRPCYAPAGIRTRVNWYLRLRKGDGAEELWFFCLEASDSATKLPAHKIFSGKLFNKVYSYGKAKCPGQDSRMGLSRPLTSHPPNRRLWREWGSTIISHPSTDHFVE